MRVYKADDMFDPQENISVKKNVVYKSELPHTHEFIELVYIYSGSGNHRVNDNSFYVQKGDLLFINFKQIHSFTSDDNMTYINLLLKPEFMSKELINTENLFDVFSLSIFDEFKGEYCNNSSIVSFRGKDMIEIECLINYLLDEFNEKQVGYKSIMNGYMQIIFSKLMRKLKTPERDNFMGYLHRLTPDILKYIDDNCFEKLTLVELAEKCFYNPAYFSRIFKECYGKSLTAYIQEKRINEAARLLKETDLSIEKIYEKAGFTDKGQFYKNFKEHMGITPKLYRIHQK